MEKKSLLWVGMAFSVMAVLYCALWAIQSAWLSATPNYTIERAEFNFNVSSSLTFLFFIISLVIGFLLYNETKSAEVIKMGNGAATLNLLKEVHNRAVELSSQLSFDKKHPLHLQSVSLYGSILELSSSIAILTKDGPKTGVPIVLRSLLEAVVDLVNLCEEPTYGYYLEAREASDWVNFLGAAAHGNNPYLDQVAEAPGLKESLEKHKEKLAGLKSKGYSPLQIKSKFKKAGMESEYATIYAELCTHSHNTIRALRKRHVEVADDGFNVVFYRLTTLDEIEHYLGMSVELLVQATERLHKLLNSDALEAVTALRNEVDGYKSKIESAYNQ